MAEHAGVRHESGTASDPSNQGAGQTRRSDPPLGSWSWVPVGRDRRVAGQAAGGTGGVVGVDGGAVFGIAWYSFQAP